ncbi:MAG: PD-(D/E)XK nuclease family protein [Planctomycetota bacterium]|nr:PD-(D/E)XK nuclease family protein [Planctomycetota bacterium]
MESPAVSEKAALDKFLADNPELEALTARLSTFNVFRALKIEHEEIRHSNTLAWLLDPQESHGLDDIVLRRILSNILLEAGAEGAESQGISAAQVELMDLTDVEVRREWQNIDVLVVIRQPDGKGIVLLIENKIHSGEGEGQLSRYRERVSKEFSEFTLLPVFLTLTGEDAGEDEDCAFIPYSHRQVRAVLERIIGQRRQQLPGAVAVFLDQYMETLRRLTMQDKDLIGLCKKIYKTHREAIDLIVEYGMASRFEEVANAILQKEGDFEVLSSGSTTVWFLPNTWSKMLPENGTVWKHLRRPVGVACWLERRPDGIKLTFEVSRMDKPRVRRACVTALRKAGFALKKAAFRKDATYSRFFNATHKVSDFDDEEQVRDAVTSLVARAREQFPKAATAFAEVFSAK